MDDILERHITGVTFVYDTDNPSSPASQEFLRYADQHVWSENANITHAARGTGERLRRTGSGFDPSRLIDCTGNTRYNPPVLSVSPQIVS